MKAKIENIKVKHRGVVLISETEEEKAVLEDIWNNHGAPCMFTRERDGQVALAIAPQPNNSEEEDDGTP